MIEQLKNIDLFQHLSKTRVFDFYSNINNYKDTLMYKDMKAIEESAGVKKRHKNADEECIYRIKHFKDIKKNGLLKPVEVYKVDDKYIIADGGGRSSACLFLGIKIKVKIITEYKGHIHHYVNEDEIEIC